MNIEPLRRGTVGDVTEYDVYGFGKVVQFDPGYFTGDANHPMDIKFILIGPEGAVHFKMSTGWLPSWAGVKTGISYSINVGRHWLTPLSPGEHSGECDVLPGRVCYSDVSYWNADEYLNTLTDEGIDALWAKLREHYDQLC